MTWLISVLSTCAPKTSGPVFQSCALLVDAWFVSSASKAYTLLCSVARSQRSSGRTFDDSGSRDDQRLRINIAIHNPEGKLPEMILIDIGCCQLGFFQIGTRASVIVALGQDINLYPHWGGGQEAGQGQENRA